MSPSKITPRNAAEWAVVLPFWMGMVGLMAVLIFWMVTGRFESAFLNVFGGLLLGGQGLRVLEKIREPLPPPPKQRVRKAPTKRQADET